MMISAKAVTVMVISIAETIGRELSEYDRLII